MQDYSFEEYNAVGGRFTPLISLGASGGFGISAGFTKKYDISSAVGVKLLYDKTKNAVGIRFLNNKEDGMLKLKFAEQGGAYIPGQSFLIKFDIDPKTYAGKYRPREIDRDGKKVYVIELAKRVSKSQEDAKETS